MGRARRGNDRRSGARSAALMRARVRQETLFYFVGDGYLTRFYHTNKIGESWETVFDGDAFRGWRATFEKSNNVVIIQAIGRSFIYNLEFTVDMRRSRKEKMS